ncbi:MAG: ATP synthase F1 subunit delta [Bacillota bacterium]|jgi:F-type H+-transporting ATPase subunit delta
MIEMINQSITRRYAKALFDIALERNTVAQYFEQWKNIVEIIDQVPEVAHIFLSKAIAPDDKKNFAHMLFADKYDEIILNFLFLIFDKSREAYITAILASYKELIDKKEGILSVSVTAAQPLSQEQKEQLIAVLSHQLDKKIRLHTEVDDTLIAGLKLRLVDKIYDGSFKRQLELLRQQLVN